MAQRYQIVIAPEAEESLQNIVEYLKTEASPNVADKVILRSATPGDF